VGISEKCPYNPLDFIEADDPLGLDACRSAAEALVVREAAQEKDRHWNDSAEARIAGYMAVTVAYGKRDNDTRSLQTVAEFVSNPEKGKMAEQLMKESPHWEGMLARAGHDLGHAQGDEAASIRSTTARHLRFFNTPAIAENTKRSTFNPANLKRKKQTIFCVISPEHMRTCSGLLRLWIDSFMKAVIREGLDENRKMFFILDESASLGHMAIIEDAADKLRGYGIRCQFYYQSMGQLKKCWPDDEGQTLLSNTTQVFFGVNDQQTADYVSARLGEATIVVQSGGTSTGGSRQTSTGQSSSQSTGSSWNENANWQQHGRKLLKPEEVLALPPRTAITFTPGVLPVCTTLVRYFEEGELFRRPGWLAEFRAAFRTLFVAGVFLVMAAVAAVTVTQAAIEKTQLEQQARHR
jgi:type IV secretion system protein VirD4